MSPRKTSENDRRGTRDYREDLTNKIIGLVEEGVAPWQKPWNANEAASTLEMPYNAVTSRAYRGGNSMWLMARSGIEGFDDPRWCTFKQASDQGWKIKRGSKASTVEYWLFEKEQKGINPDTGRTETLTVKVDPPRVFYAQVFNAKQIEGIPAYEPCKKELWNPVEDAERALSHSGVKILHDQIDRAFYSPARDSIHVPPRPAFKGPLEYYETTLHELAHASGHESRMSRDLSGSFGSEAYAREELRAQMASLFLSAELGVPFNPERHAAYQASWVKVLQDDKHEIFRAARDAEHIAEYVIGLARERSKELDHEQAHPERIFEPDQSHSMSLPETPAAMAVAPLRSQFAEVRCDPLAFQEYGENAKPVSDKYNRMLDAIESRLQPYAEFLSAHAAAADAQYYLDELWSREEKLGALLQLDSNGIEAFVDKTFTLKAISRCAAAPFLVSDIEKQYQLISRELETKPQGAPEEGRAHAIASRLESNRANATHSRDNGNGELDQPVTPQPRHIQIKIGAWRRQHEALQAPAYRITLTSRREELKTYNMGKGRGPDGQEKFYTSREIEEQIPFLSRQNARGYDIYVTPISESDHYMVLDDSTKAKINHMHERYGFRPCLVQESSPGNFQAVIRAEKKPGEHEQSSANICVRKMNQEYGDPKFSGAVHPFRVAGFSNAKPKYENEHGHRPFVRIIEAQNVQCPQASQWLDRTRREHEQDLNLPHERQLKRAPVQEPAHVISDHARSSASPGAVTKDQQTVNDRFLQARAQHRGLAKQKGWAVNDSVLDYRAARDCLRQGDDPECVKCALETCSPAISGRHSNVRYYAERTLAKALEDSQVQKLRAKVLGRQQKQGQVLGL